MKLLGRLIKLVVVTIVILVTVDLALVFGFAHYRPPIPKADAIIVLGAAINTPALYNRTMEGLRLYEDGKADELVLSGGKIAAADISEAQYMEKVIKQNADPLPLYVKEDQSHTTYENIRNSRQVLDGKQNIIIVSDRYHLARAVLTAKRAGFKDVSWSAPDPNYYSARELRYYYFREVAAMLSYIPYFIFG
jgi:uncharacterized SAM-binding protein YcdF (DUF218 family)